MTTVELCDRSEDHGLATSEVRTHKGESRSHPVYLCDECTRKIDPRLVGVDYTVSIEPIGDNT